MRHRRAAVASTARRSWQQSQKSIKASKSRQASLDSHSGRLAHATRSSAPSPSLLLPPIPGSDAWIPPEDERGDATGPITCLEPNQQRTRRSRARSSITRDTHNAGIKQDPGRDQEVTLKARTVDPYWTDGDFAFVSVDEREFRVSSTALSKQSAVFASLLARVSRLTGDNYMRIHFTEPSRLISLFLTALFSRKIPWDLSLSVPDAVQLMLFAKHFECDDLIDRLVPILAGHAKEKKTNPYEVFRAGAVCERWDLCEVALTAHSAKWKWGRSRADETPIDLALGCVHGEPFLDPLALPYHWYMQLPKKALWALTRATTQKTADGKTRSWRQRADRFRELIRMIEDGQWPKYTEMTK